MASNSRSYKMSASPTTPYTPKADLEFTNLNGRISILDLKGNPNNMVPKQEAANNNGAFAHSDQHLIIRLSA